MFFQISEQMEHFQTLLNSPSVASPIYGCALDEHLKKHGGYVALPIRICVCRMIQVKRCIFFVVRSSRTYNIRLGVIFLYYILNMSFEFSLLVGRYERRRPISRRKFNLKNQTSCRPV